MPELRRNRIAEIRQARADFRPKVERLHSKKVQIMRHRQLQFESGFQIAMSTKTAQAAEMVIQPGKSEGGPENIHQGSDQWMYVVSGTGVAIINDHRYELTSGTLMLIEHGDRHEIRTQGNAPLRTLNFYSPPAYRDD